MKFKKILSLLFAMIFILSNFTNIYAETAVATMPELPTVTGEAYIVADKTTGRILYSKNPDAKLYPASLTKLLTALVSVEYLSKDDLIKVGEEVNTIPWDSSIAGHKFGEYITYENLLRGLLLPSGNDSATVIALNVARKVSGNENISLEEALTLFSGLMNDKAKSLGAVSSHFVTPHGYHNENHYTTPHDIMLIAQEALKNETIAEICSEKFFQGYGAGEQRTVDMLTQEYTWDNTNLLLGGRLATSDQIYKNATGVKTGSTSEAGYCLVSSATNADDENLISVVMKSNHSDIWADSKKLLNYGFENYSNVVLQPANTMVKEVLIDKPRLGDEKILELVTANEVSILLNETEVPKITTSIEVSEEKKAKSKNATQDTTLMAPLKRGESVGNIKYSLDGTVLYSDDIVAKNDVLKRSIGSSLKYYAKVTKDILFSWMIIPISTAVALMTVFGMRFYNIYKKKRERLRRSRKYKLRTKD